MVFTEHGENYWLVESLPQFAQTEKGRSGTLFVIKVGYAHIEAKLQPGLLVGKFVKP